MLAHGDGNAFEKGGVGHFMPRTTRTFAHAHTIICDAEECGYGEQLADALKNLGFSQALVAPNFGELLETGRMTSMEVVFLNPHCNERSEETQVRQVHESLTRRHVQLVLLRDARQGDEGNHCISKNDALNPDALRRLMAVLEREWERHQFRRYDVTSGGGELGRHTPYEHE